MAAANVLLGVGLVFSTLGKMDFLIIKGLVLTIYYFEFLIL